MTAYRGRLTGPLSNVPAGLAEAVERARKYRVLVQAVCPNDHILATVLETSMGRVVLWRPSSRFADPRSDGLARPAVDTLGEQVD